MSGVKGMKGSGGARPGAGRKTLVTEREVKVKLQEFLPDAYGAIKEGLEDNVVFAKLHRVRLDNAWKVINKFAGDRKSIEVSGDPDRPLGVVMLPSKYAESKLETSSRPADGISEET